MRPDEEYAGVRLVEFFGGPERVSVSDGEKRAPPDLYLDFSDRRVAVEVTQLSQLTFEPNGTLGNRATQDAVGRNLVDDLDAELGPQLPEDLSLLIGMEVPVQNPARFKREIRKLVDTIIAAPVLGARTTRNIEGSNVRTEVIPRRRSGKKIVGILSNKNASADIDLNARSVLGDRVRAKIMRCKSFKEPIWLALVSDYPIAAIIDTAAYKSAARRLSLDHCFERVFLVPRNGAVCELEVGAHS